MTRVSGDPVANRNNLSPEQFNGLSRHDQERVVNARVNDLVLKPIFDRAISRMREAKSELSKTLKGET